MLIDIQIKDATPEDLRRMFGDCKAEPFRDCCDPIGEIRGLVDTLQADTENTRRLCLDVVREVVEPKSKEVIEKTVNPPHEPRIKEDAKIASTGDRVVDEYLKSTADKIVASHHDDQTDALARSVIPSDGVPKKIDARKIGGKKPGKHKQHGDLHLTVTFSEDKKEYQRQWSVCRKHNFIPYPEAVKLEAAKKADSPKVEKEIRDPQLEKPETDTKVEEPLQDNDPIVEKKKTVRMVKCPQCDYSCDPRALHLHIQKKHKEATKQPQSETEKPKEVVLPIPFPPTTKSAEAPVSSESRKADDFTIGTHVKQIKPFLDRKVSGIGVVVAHKNGLVECNFGGQQYYKIAPACLESV